MSDDLIKKIEVLLSSDNTEQMDFEGEVDRELYKMCNNEEIQLMNGTLFGNKTKEGKVVLVDDLLNLSYINFDTRIMIKYIRNQETFVSRERLQESDINKNVLLRGCTETRTMWIPRIWQIIQALHKTLCANT